jgi:hypothetical protein
VRQVDSLAERHLQSGGITSLAGARLLRPSLPLQLRLQRVAAAEQLRRGVVRCCGPLLGRGRLLPGGLDLLPAASAHGQQPM